MVASEGQAYRKVGIGYPVRNGALFGMICSAHQIG